MAPLNTTKALASSLTRHLNNSHAAIDARHTVVPDLTLTRTKHVLGIIIAGTVLGLVLTIIFCRFVPAGGRAPDPPSEPGHLYGHDNASRSIVLAALRSASSYERPRAQEVEDRASCGQESGGVTVAHPAPAVTRMSDSRDDSPPPYPQPPKYKMRTESDW